MTDNINGEAIFYSHTFTTKSGHKITLACDKDLAESLDAMGAGTRYMIALVPIADDETPDRDKLAKVKKPVSVSTLAALLCSDMAFWQWIGATNSDDVKEWLYTHFDIRSRAEFDTNPAKAQAFMEFREKFMIDVGRIPQPLGGTQ